MHIGKFKARESASILERWARLRARYTGTCLDLNESDYAKNRSRAAEASRIRSATAFALVAFDHAGKPVSSACR